jgi:TolB-like protein/class 3 adenylate cyclase/Tfp pilus assembly protein PilF
MVRRLTSIVAADVVGYSALMAQDEDGTFAALQALRTTLLLPLIKTHSGRVVKLMGDGMLAEFASIVDAVEFAIAFQTAVGDFLDGRIKLRIGVNLGDIISKGGDIFGDGVNIAARLEALADTGGICISGIVMESLGHRVKAHFVDDGDHQLKNIPRPVRVFRWVASPQSKVPQLGSDGQSDWKSGRPSIVVLAFDNMSGDPEQEYFSDGIAEDIITALSHFKEFFVIARNTSFTFKGQAVRVDQVCRELGVRYLLEGSVRKAGNKVRVTAQLIDGESGAHVWATKLDRNLDDIFAVQDEITQAIVGAVAPETMGAELKRSRSKGAENLTAWDKVMQARWHLGIMTQRDYQKARSLLTQAVAAEPDMSEAFAGLALCDLMDMLHLWAPDTTQAITSALQAARMALSLDDSNASAHGMLAMAASFARQYDEAKLHLDRSVYLNPNLAIGYGNFTAYYGVSGEMANARKSYERALELSPRDPLKPFWNSGLGISLFVAAEYEECVELTTRALKDRPNYASLMRQQAASLGMLGRHKEASASVSQLLQVMPDLTISRVRHMVPVRYPEDHERWLEGLRRAGLPE